MQTHEAGRGGRSEKVSVLDFANSTSVGLGARSCVQDGTAKGRMGLEAPLCRLSPKCTGAASNRGIGDSQYAPVCPRGVRPRAHLYLHCRFRDGYPTGIAGCPTRMQALLGREPERKRLGAGRRTQDSAGSSSVKTSARPTPPPSRSRPTISAAAWPMCDATPRSASPCALPAGLLETHNDRHLCAPGGTSTHFGPGRASTAARRDGLPRRHLRARERRCTHLSLWPVP